MDAFSPLEVGKNGVQTISGFHVASNIHFCNDFVNHMCAYVSESCTCTIGTTLGELLMFSKTIQKANVKHKQNHP